MKVFSRRPLLFLAVGVMVSTALLAACGGDDDDDGGDGGGGGTAVDVTLSEFVLEADPASVSAGEVTFTASNEGEEVHEFVVVKTDLAPDKLPTIDDGSVDEEGAGVEAVDEIEDLASGDSQDLTATLDAGNYVLFCNLVEEGEVHYKEGMHAAFTVE
jgi:uncharacterized cupredoxin-like copper-binding protein